MEPGNLNKRVTIEAPSPSQNAYGEDEGKGWTYVAKVWCSIKTLSGRQLSLSQANTITATSTHQVTIRYRKRLLPTHRLAYSQSGSELPVRHFSIDAITDTDERHEELVLTCTEILA
jgi:SPP1 family predicted phage head-tail adaptor